jgi:hypothetical protein
MSTPIMYIDITVLRKPTQERIIKRPVFFQNFQWKSNTLFFKTFHYGLYEGFIIDLFPFKTLLEECYVTIESNPPSNI